MTTSRGFQALSLAAALLLGPAVAQAGHHGVNVSIDDGDHAVRCDDIRIEIGNRPAARAEARTVIAVPAGGKALDVRAAQSSGVRVYGTDRADFEVLLCKAAPAGGDLDAIALTHEGGSVSVRGPAEGSWVGYLLIAAPRGAAVSVHSENGPVSLSALQGRVEANSQNGPVSLDACTGDVDVQAQNGPIQVRGDEGRLHVRTQNGPIGVALSAAGWKSGTLDASAVNGPVSLAVAAGYRSGTIVESLGHSPVQCRGEVCADARRTWNDDGKRIEIGDAPVVVRLSTRNGPVTVKTGADADDDDGE
jgi:hypothetical protein